MFKQIGNFFNRLDQSLTNRKSFIYKKTKQTAIATKSELNAVFGAVGDVLSPQESPPSESKSEVEGN